MRYGYTREQAEKGVDAANAWWAQYRRDESPAWYLYREVEVPEKRTDKMSKKEKTSAKKPSFNVKDMYARAAKPASGTKEERIRRITALGVSREDAIKAVNAEDSFRARQRRIQSATPKMTTTQANKTYTVWDTKTGKTFATQGEAIAYANEKRRKTGEILSVTQTKRKVTHTFVGGKNSPKR